jgi:hypothetical protein
VVSSLSDGNTTDVNPNAADEATNRFEAAGVIFSNTQTVGTLKFINGTFDITSGNVRGPWASALVVQYTLNGTTLRLRSGQAVGNGDGVDALAQATATPTPRRGWNTRLPAHRLRM